MQVQLSAIIIPPLDSDAEAVTQFLQDEALPAADRTVLTRITRGVIQRVMKGEDRDTGRVYYLWRAELDLMTDQGTVGPGLADEMWEAMRAQLATQEIVLTTPLVLALPKRPE